MYLDTGCFDHMTGKKSWFAELDHLVIGEVISVFLTSSLHFHNA